MVGWCGLLRFTRLRERVWGVWAGGLWLHTGWVFVRWVGGLMDV